MKKIKLKLLNKIILSLIFLSVTLNSIPVCAGYGGNGDIEGGVEGDIDITLESIGFDDHRGMKAYINGREVFCIQRGHPFRSSVSELQMVYSTVQSGLSQVEHDGTIASLIRYILHRSTGFIDIEYFRGWGEWTINDDHTDAIQTSDDGAPSSLAWQEIFDEDMEDHEDDSYNNRYQGTGSVRKWTQQIKELITGHEGCIEPFKTQMKKITYQEAGFDISQLYAQAMIHYYVYEDSDSSSYSDDAKYQCEQAMDWAVQYKFITAIGPGGDLLRVIYKDSDGYYGVSRSNYYSGSCDGYIKTTIGGQYEALKLYRQVVWKTVNMRMIPSFAYKIDDIGSVEPIKLYWDEDIQKYTATVSDSNGVLNYFDFEIPGVEITSNGDGTLTITSANEINGELTSLQKASRLEPEDGIFKLPTYYRWNLEGKLVKYKYTVLKPLVKSIIKNISQEANDGGGPGRENVLAAVEFEHQYDWGCNWYCTNGDDTKEHCTHEFNNCDLEANYCQQEVNDCDEEANDCPHSCDNDCEGGSLTCTNTDATHTHTDSCYSSKYCSHSHGSGCHSHSKESDKCHSHSKESDKCHSHSKESDKCHAHVDEAGTGCYHRNYCDYYAEEERVGVETFVHGAPQSDCVTEWCCGKEHYETEEKDISGQYIDWQDISGVYAEGKKLIDPTYAYIKVTTVFHKFPAQTDTEILLIADNDEWNDLTYTAPNGKVIQHSSHLRVGEKFHLKYIYSYEGASKGFSIEFTLENKPYYQYNYLSRMQAPQNATPIYKLRTGLVGDRFSQSFSSVPHAKLVIEETPVTIRGLYQTPETAYTLNGVYSWDSQTSWNDNLYLDALTADQFDDWYDNKAADDYTGANGGEKITTNVTSPLLTDFTVSKADGKIQAVWEFDTEPEVFSSALVFGTSYINVAEDTNHTRTFYDEAYNYAKDAMGSTGYTDWFYNLEDHNNVGGVGYFSWEYTDPNGVQSETLIPSHTIFTQNNEYRTYAVRNKVWQSDVDIKVSNFVQNTGAGITEHIYQQRGRDNHDINYNLYYTIDVENPKATIFEDKQKAANGSTTSDQKTTPYDTTSDVYEFDVNNMVAWGSTGASQTGASYGSTVVVDHIKTGRTYIQREIPTILATMTSNPKETMNFKIYPNHDRLIYEDYYSNVVISGSDTNRKVTVSVKDGYYPPNEQSASSDIWPAMNPNIKEMQPQNINGSNNVPDQYNQGDNALHHIAPTTSFNIKLSNGETKTVVDSHTKNYTQYDFEYNPSNRNNKVTFPSRRKSIMFFKYSKTNYSYDGKNIQSAVGEFKNLAKTQTESYYISRVLFKSNYTSKYKKELEHQGADYIENYDANGNLLDAWIDMVNQNKFAIVSAGQGFELRITLKYENSYLTQYLSRYFGQDDGQNDILGTSNRVQKNYLTSSTERGRQFANISSLTGKDGRTVPFYKDTERAYISSNSILDRLAVNLVTGSNVFNDLYVFMSDNPDTVYSYSGIYDTPVVFERNIKYSEDFSVTTITYTMCVSHENGISSSLQKMKFYTNQLAPDKRSPGIVEGMTDVSANGEHSITIWTPIVAATPFDYPSAAQDRYIGDAIELGYTIKTTGADDSIVHIVQ